MSNHSQLRRDPHHGGWVLVNQQPEREALINIPRDEWPLHCFDPFCNPHKAGTNVIHSVSSTMPNGQEESVRVIANRFALYRVEGAEEREGKGMYDQMQGIGAHEIIIESSKHEDTLISMLPHQYVLTLQAIQDRMNDLQNDVRLQSFTIFREWFTGKSKPTIHPHSQLIANSIIPLGILNEMNAAHEYFSYRERCLFCDMIRQEISDKERLISVNDRYISYCPFASRNPFEIHLFPRKHHHWFGEEPHDNLPSLAEMIRDIAYRLEKAVPDWQVTMVLHTTPDIRDRQRYSFKASRSYHWHLEFLPQPPGSLDWYNRTGTPVEHTPPEKAAEFLHKIKVPSPWT